MDLQERTAGESRELDFNPWGGAYNRVTPDATAFVHRDALFQLKHAAVVDPQASRGEQQAAHRWVRRSWASAHRWGSGRVFQKFPDPELEDWADAYYGPNHPRLVQVKARYDPAGFSTVTSRSLLADAAAVKHPQRKPRGHEHREVQMRSRPTSEASAVWSDRRHEG